MTVTIERTDAVAVLRLDAGPGNPINPRSAADLLAGLADAVDDGAGAIVVTGTGSTFSAGGDFAMLTEWIDWTADKRAAMAREGPQAISRALVACPVPTVAAINGGAAGAGLDLTLACDIRVMAPGATLATGYVHVAMIPGDGGAWLLPRFVGLGRALELLVTGRRLDATEAVAIGIVHQVADDVVAAAVALATDLATRPPGTVAAIRRLVFEAVSAPFDEHLEEAARLLGELTGRPQHAEAVQAMQRRIGR